MITLNQSYDHLQQMVLYLADSANITTSIGLHWRAVCCLLEEVREVAGRGPPRKKDGR